MYMPKFYTILHIKSTSCVQKIKLDEDCEEFEISDRNKVRRVKNFLRFVSEIKRSKPEIKAAPTSDIMYL